MIMPHTRKVDDRHSVTIRSDRRRGGGGWESTGDIFVTATNEDVGPTVHGEGRTMTSAEERAFQEARRWCSDRRPEAEEDD
jgi:hypothetical protein